MRIRGILPALALLGLTACSTTDLANHPTIKADPETVLVTYRVKAGREGEFQAVLLRAWQVYTEEHLVLAEPHIIVRDTEDGAKVRLVEVLTWVGHDSPGQASAAVQAIWRQEQSLCEARGGHGGIEGGEVELLIPTH